jgi:FkbM family methyltransferase
MQFGDLSLKRCRYGWMLYPGPLSPGPFIGKCLELYGQYSEGEVALMRAFLHEGDTVIDVGANIGAFTVPMAQMVGDKGSVYAVESDPQTFNVLCANLALNGIRNTKPLNGFVATGEGAVAEVTNTTSGPVGNPSASAFLTLDSLELNACHFIKVDVDGGELEVFRSGEMQIERFRPILYFENELRDKSVELLRFVIDTLGYHLYFHPTPLFEPSNFFGNTVNHWAPTEFVSMMVLGVPAERKLSIGLKRITDPNDWWDFSVPVSSYFNLSH